MSGFSSPKAKLAMQATSSNSRPLLLPRIQHVSFVRKHNLVPTVPLTLLPLTGRMLFIRTNVVLSVVEGITMLLTASGNCRVIGAKVRTGPRCVLLLKSLENQRMVTLSLKVKLSLLLRTRKVTIMVILKLRFQLE